MKYSDGTIVDYVATRGLRKQVLFFNMNSVRCILPQTKKLQRISNYIESSEYQLIPSSENSSYDKNLTFFHSQKKEIAGKKKQQVLLMIQQVLLINYFFLLLSCYFIFAISSSRFFAGKRPPQRLSHAILHIRLGLTRRSCRKQLMPKAMELILQHNT